MKRIVLCFLLSVAAGTAFAQYPNRPVRFVMPYPPGGSSEILARPIAIELTKQLGQPVIIDYKPGGGTTIGADFIAKSPPDGYTLIMLLTAHAINASLMPRLPYDTQKDFASITLAATQPLVVEVPAQSPVKSLQELVAADKANPGKLNYGSAGPGNTSHLGVEYFNSVVGTKFTHVPYKGGAPAAADLATGIVQVMFDSLGTQTPNIKAGKVRPIAVMLAQRSPVLPEVPTVGEAGFPHVEFSTWNGLFGPAGMPKELVAKIVAGVREALAAPEVREKLATMGSAVTMDSGEVLLKVLQADLQRFAELARQAKIERQ